MAFTMACPNFKKSLKMAFGPLGVKMIYDRCSKIFSIHYTLHSI
jgi:serine protease inhibitor ecotin